MKKWGALGSVFAQARRNIAQTRPEMKFWVLLGSILLKQENFHLGENGSCPSEQIFAQVSKKTKKIHKIFIFSFESIVYYCLLYLSENSNFYLKI